MSPTEFIRSLSWLTALIMVGWLAFGGIREPFRGWIQAILWGVAMTFGALIVLNEVHVPARNVNESFGYIAWLLALFVIIAPKHQGIRYGLRALFIGAMGYMMFHFIAPALKGGVAIRNLLAFFLLGMAVWSITERASSEVKRTTLTLLPFLIASSLSGYFLLSGSASFSQMIAAVSALQFGAFLIAWFKPHRFSERAAIPYLSVYLIAFMAAGHFYLDINPWVLLGFCFPYLLLWVRPNLTFLPKHPVLEPVILGAVGLIPLVFLLWNSYRTSAPLY